MSKDSNPRHVGVASDPGAWSVKLGDSQTGSQTLPFSRGKKTKYKVSAEKEILLQSNSSFESEHSCC